MMQGSSKSLIALRAPSVARYCCIPVPTVVVTNNIRTISASTVTGSDTTIKRNNSVIPSLPELHYQPEQITIDAAAQALYAKLPRGEAWDRQPEDIRLLNGTDKESIYKLGKHRSNALELVHRIPVVEVEGDIAICDGGGGGLGHPLEYISLVVPGSINYCKYCSLRYTKKKGHKSSAH